MHQKCAFQSAASLLPDQMPCFLQVSESEAHCDASDRPQAACCTSTGKLQPSCFTERACLQGRCYRLLCCLVRAAKDTNPLSERLKGNLLLDSAPHALVNDLAEAHNRPVLVSAVLSALAACALVLRATDPIVYAMNACITDAYGVQAHCICAAAKTAPLPVQACVLILLDIMA